VVLMQYANHGAFTDGTGGRFGFHDRDGNAQWSLDFLRRQQSVRRSTAS
jgi:hypothetical protein